MVYADRLMRLLAEEALCRLPSIAEDGVVETPVGTAREEGTKNGKEIEEREGKGKRREGTTREDAKRG